MEAKAIYENMASGTWTIFHGHRMFIEDGNGEDICDTVNGGSNGDRETNAAAIVSAVNSTWGRSINPEKVPDILDMLEVLYSNFKKDMDYDLDERVEALINSAKL